MIRLAYGLPGTGKSTLLHDLVSAQAHEHLFLVHDHEAGWGEDSPLWRGAPPRLQLVQGEDELDALKARPPNGVLVFRNVEPESIQELAVRWGNVVYVDDEIDKAGRRKGFDESALRAMVNEGRHLPNGRGEPSEVHVLGACRRPQKIHNDLSEMADEVFVFRCMGNRTLSRLLDDAVVEDDDIVRIRDLPNFQFLHWPSRKWLSIAPL